MKIDMTESVDDNLILPFQLEESLLRGRAVRLGAVLDNVLASHEYPHPVAHLVAETMTLALLLSSMLKFDGIFTLQIKGDGPVSMLVADVTSNGAVRACATYDEERLQHARKKLSALKSPETSQNHLAQYLGKGYLVFTVDQPAIEDRYQGIVELKGASLVECVQHYFTQSEQIGTGIKMATGMRGGHWRAGAIMLQHLPEEGKNPEAGMGNTREDDWRRAMVLLNSCTDDEFLSPDIMAEDILLRLFHEEGIRAYAPVVVRKECRCSEMRVRNVLAMMDMDDREHITVNGKIIVRCEFCSKDYLFNPDALGGTMKQ